MTAFSSRGMRLSMKEFSRLHARRREGSGTLLPGKKLKTKA